MNEIEKEKYSSETSPSSQTSKTQPLPYPNSFKPPFSFSDNEQSSDEENCFMSKSEKSISTKISLSNIKTVLSNKTKAVLSTVVPTKTLDTTTTNTTTLTSENKNENENGKDNRVKPKSLNKQKHKSVQFPLVSTTTSTNTTISTSNNKSCVVSSPSTNPANFFFNKKKPNSSTPHTHTNQDAITIKNSAESQHIKSYSLSSSIFSSVTNIESTEGIATPLMNSFTTAINNYFHLNTNVNDDTEKKDQEEETSEKTKESSPFSLPFLSNPVSTTTPLENDSSMIENYEHYTSIEDYKKNIPKIKRRHSHNIGSGYDYHCYIKDNKNKTKSGTTRTPKNMDDAQALLRSSNKEIESLLSAMQESTRRRIKNDDIKGTQDGYINEKEGEGKKIAEEGEDEEANDFDDVVPTPSALFLPKEKEIIDYSSEKKKKKKHRHRHHRHHHHHHHTSLSNSQQKLHRQSESIQDRQYELEVEDNEEEMRENMTNLDQDGVMEADDESEFKFNNDKNKNTLTTSMNDRLHMRKHKLKKTKLDRSNSTVTILSESFEDMKKIRYDENGQILEENVERKEEGIKDEMDEKRRAEEEERERREEEEEAKEDEKNRYTRVMDRKGGYGDDLLNQNMKVDDEGKEFVIKCRRIRKTSSNVSTPTTTTKSSSGYSLTTDEDDLYEMSSSEEENEEEKVSSDDHDELEREDSNDFIDSQDHQLVFHRYNSLDKERDKLDGEKEKKLSFRQKYFSQPIKYSFSALLHYGMEALSSIFNLQVDDVFGMDELEKAVLPEPTLRGIAEYIKSGYAKNIIVLSGAGISTTAGIPDFRSPRTGLYFNLKKYNLPYPEAIFTLDYFKKNPEPFYHMARTFYPGNYKPTLSHYFIKELQDRKLLLRNYTQNIDCLERICGIYDNKLIEAHGSFNSAYCIGTVNRKGCKAVYDYKWLYKKLFPPDHKFVIPRCEKCNGLVKPAISFFGESIPDKVSEYAKDDFTKCDLLIVMGTSLKVEPLARLVHEVSITTPRLLMNRTMVGCFDKEKAKFGYGGARRNKWQDLDIFNDPDLVEEALNRDVVHLGDCDETCLKLAGYLGFKKKLLRTYEKEMERLDLEIGEGVDSATSLNHSTFDDPSEVDNLSSTSLPPLQTPNLNTTTTTATAIQQPSSMNKNLGKGSIMMNHPSPSLEKNEKTKKKRMVYDDEDKEEKGIEEVEEEVQSIDLNDQMLIEEELEAENEMIYEFDDDDDHHHYQKNTIPQNTYNKNNQQEIKPIISNHSLKTSSLPPNHNNNNHMNCKNGIYN